MKSATHDKEYRSPRQKLVRFFEKSRDQWKAKCRAAKTRLKYIQGRNRVLQASRAHWRARAQAIAQELAAAQATVQALRAEVAQYQAQNRPSPAVSPAVSALAQVPARQQYTVGQVSLFLDLVLADATSLRGAGRVLARLGARGPEGAAPPTWTTGRLWLLRLGYYKLTRPKAHAADWVWIVDHTVQLGVEKCLLILGFRLSALPAVGQCLRHQDVEPLALLPVVKSDGEVVYQQLEAQGAQTGVPRAIVSDHGSDLKAGIAKFCTVHSETVATYDIKHKTAAVLKRELGGDPTWQAFAHQAAHTKRQVQQTAWAALAPPSQRTKARYMNVEVLLAWGQRTLAFLAQPESTGQPFDVAQVQQKIGWVTEFRAALAEWAALLQVVVTTESYIRQRGFYSGVSHELETQLMPWATTPRTQAVAKELVEFVTQEAGKTRPGERLLGSSEIIESVFGQQKFLERDQARNGFTGLLLAVCATVAETTAEVVRQALEAVSTQQVWDWCRENLGPSVQAQRRRAFPTAEKVEQKWDQAWTPV